MTEEYLQKIEVIRERLGVSYKEAKEALDQAGGDVVQAIVNLEEKGKEALEKNELGKKLFARIKSIIQKGNATKIKVKKDDNVVLEIPATLGALGVLGMLMSAEFAIIAGLGSVAAMLNEYTLEIEKKDGTIEEAKIDDA
ncbi:MAG TPA: hypothetical protein DEA47_02815 [Peptococcaceae bacterium]|nr:MAG: hypothetical protein XD50_1467 [Clostridia bacterium 41_269]HBT20289.1 hypothetical protein [Peptococcaceae bacterium]